jgi:hypothetical protein
VLRARVRSNSESVFPVTIRLEAGRTTLSLSGFKNSSLRISPGGTGRIPFFFILLLLDDLTIKLKRFMTQYTRDWETKT